MATLLAWMRKYWPLSMAAAYLLCHAVILLVGWVFRLPLETPRHFSNGPGIAGGVLFGATFFGVRWLRLGRRRIAGAAIVVLSLLGYGWRIYFDFDTASSAIFLAKFQTDGDSRISRIPEMAMRSNRGRPGHSGRIAAQFYFRETGIAIPYRDESDEVRMFEPNDKATSSRAGVVEGRELLDKSRPMFRAYAVTFWWFGCSNFLLAAGALFGAMALFRHRKPQVTIDSPAELPVPGQ
jgi:hypothetical protein